MEGTWCVSDFSLSALILTPSYRAGKLSRSLISLCKASLATLTDISITLYDGLFAQFFRLHFPKLVTFRVGPGHEHFENKEALAVGSALTSFLMAHLDLAHLELVYSTSMMLDEVTAYIPLDRKALSPNALPKLQLLEAHPSQVYDFLSAGVQFFKTLSSLRLSCGVDGELLISKLSNYAKMNGPCNLEELVAYRNTLDLKRSSKTFHVYIEQVAAVFPNLERWQGATPQPFDMVSTYIQKVFSQLIQRALKIKTAKSLSLLPSLRQIVLWDTMSQAAVMAPHDAEVLATSLPLLESVESRKIRTIFEVSRNNEEAKVSITSKPSLKFEERSDYHEDSDADNDCPDTDEYYSTDSNDTGESDSDE